MARKKSIPPFDIDPEVKQLAAQALTNAFWTSFSSLVNAYLVAGEGLGVNMHERLADKTSLYGRDDEAGVINVTIVDGDGRYFDTLAQALKEGVRYIRIGPTKVFEKREDGWFYVA